MDYKQGFQRQVDTLRDYLLGEISFEEFEETHEKTKESYKVVFESHNLEEFSKKMYEFFPDKDLVAKRIIHEKRHADISIKHGFKVKFTLKSYERGGKTRYRPSVIEEDSEKLKKKWSKTKLWQYTFDQVDSDDASDNDKIMKKMLLEIKDKVFKGKINKLDHSHNNKLRD
ncbi:MAG: hypothetical protein AABX53_00640 [Nanoarchaeota archaeon]